MQIDIQLWPKRCVSMSPHHVHSQDALASEPMTESKSENEGNKMSMATRFDHD